MEKIPYDIPEMLSRIAEAVRPYPQAALNELAQLGHSSAFEQLVACMISIRTRDEATLPIARGLFARARTPGEMAALPVEEVDALIRQSSFHEAKARQIKAIAQTVAERYGGVLPCQFDVLTSFSGVGPKCANLVLGIACGQPTVAVDVHVHRVTNRWGLVATRAPEETMVALEKAVARECWLDLNRLLVPFGKHICTGRLPHCSTCPVLAYCRQVGVSEHR